jgi:heme/copper-type cytochrome/quinol oxidase subunit 3
MKLKIFNYFQSKQNINRIYCEQQIYSLNEASKIFWIKSNKYSIKSKNELTSRFLCFNNKNFFFEKIKNFSEKKTHNFYIAPTFIFSIVASISTCILLYSTVKFFHNQTNFSYFKLNLVCFLGTVFYWLWLLNKQAFFASNFTKTAQQNITTGIILFIISEVIIFFGIFWTFFHSSLAPTFDIGSKWPPFGTTALEWWKWPTLGTFILIYSGFSVNVFFYTIKLNNTKIVFNCASEQEFHNNVDEKVINQEVKIFSDNSETKNKVIFKNWSIMFSSLLHTLAFGFIFLICQKHEYAHATYSGSDGIYGTVFFGITGLHGLHVFLGFILLGIVLYQQYTPQVVFNETHVSTAGAVWYWHFVDIVWLFV